MGRPPRTPDQREFIKLRRQLHSFLRSFYVPGNRWSEGEARAYLKRLAECMARIEAAGDHVPVIERGQRIKRGPDRVRLIEP